MKLSHYTIIFVIIILPFSFICRNTINEYFLTLKDQVRLNNVIDTATQDALETLIELNDEFQMLYLNERFDVTEVLAKESIKTFFKTLAINFNMPYIEGYTESYFSMYIPAIVVIGYDGFFIYSVDDSGTGTYAYQLSPKIPYAYEDVTSGAIINFTLGNYIKMYTNGRLYEGELTDNYYEESETKYEEYLTAFGGSESETLKYLPDLVSDMSIMVVALDKAGKSVPSFLISKSGDGAPIRQDYGIEIDASPFHAKRREIIVSLIVETLQEEINSHNTYASLMGSVYNFALPDIDGTEWRNSINDISIMSFIQGMPIGINSYYNNYALGASRIVETDYIYGTVDSYYHSSDCENIAGFIEGGTPLVQVNNIFVNRVQAAELGYYPCMKCSP